MQLYFSDLHIHSRFSRATSKYLTFPNLYKWARLKGINLLGTGDIVHPKWLEEAYEYLTLDENRGFYKLTSKLASTLNKELPDSVLQTPDMYFVPTVETSHIYKQDDKLRRIHILIILPTLEDAKRLSAKLATYSNISADGRPIFGINVRDLTHMVLEISDKAMVIPAHIWTPHFSLFGSKSGFDKLEEAFGDMAKYIKALETGLSSDPEMNRLVKDLDNYILTSNSDSHSLERIGREANIHTKLDTYEDLYEALTKGEGLYGTVEYFPQEGKYHYDGHRACKYSVSPLERGSDTICPKCGKPLTIGVLARVYELAKGNPRPSTTLLTKYKSIHAIPLDDILSALLKVGRTSKKVRTKLFETISELGPELHILTQLSPSEISKYDPLLAAAIDQMRQGKIKIVPGYDGEYGVVEIDTNSLKTQEYSQLSLI